MKSTKTTRRKAAKPEKSAPLIPLELFCRCHGVSLETGRRSDEDIKFVADLHGKPNAKETLRYYAYSPSFAAVYEDSFQRVSYTPCGNGKTRKAAILDLGKRLNESAEWTVTQRVIDVKFREN